MTPIGRSHRRLENRPHGTHLAIARFSRKHKPLRHVFAIVCGELPRQEMTSPYTCVGDRKGGHPSPKATVAESPVNKVGLDCLWFSYGSGRSRFRHLSFDQAHDDHDHRPANTTATDTREDRRHIQPSACGRGNGSGQHTEQLTSANTTSISAMVLPNRDSD